jgi:osmotically-inducible protein OsmY
MRERYEPSDVVVRVKYGEVTLQGSIDGRDAKRRVEDTVDDVAGVRQVHNFLQVTPRGGQAGIEQPRSAGGRQT